LESKRAPLPRGRAAVRESMTSTRAAWVIAGGLAVMLVGAFFVVQAALGRFPFGQPGDPTDARIALVHCLLISYLIGAFLYVRAGAREAIASLAPHLELPDPALNDALRQVGRYPRGALAVLLLLGLLFSLSGPFLTGPASLADWHPGRWSAEVAWHRVLGLGIGWGINWMAFAVVSESMRMSRLASSLKPISLWDARPLGPFTRQGQRNALVAVGLVSVFALFVPAQGITNAFLVILAVALVLALLGFLLPLRGVHRMIHKAKQRELDWAAEVLEQERARFQQQSSGNGRLADIIAYRTAVEQVREWPFDQSSVLRIVLYLLVPIASWLISNLAAELLERTVFRGG
jgi:hypothetical protein